MEQRTIKFSSFDEDFWNNLEKLRKTILMFPQRRSELTADSSNLHPLRGDKGNQVEVSEHLNKDIPNKECLLQRIKKIFEEFLCRERNDRKATLAVPNRNLWKNTNFKKNEGIKLIKNPVLKTIGNRSGKSSKRLVLIQHVLTKIYKLIETGSYKTKRELYYEDPTLYKTQTIVDEILDDIACLLNVSKIHLHVLTTSKGCIAGRLRYKDADGNYIDCEESAQGMMIPTNIKEVTNIQSDARFILVVEKSAVYQMLMDCNITSSLHPCIMITGKGFPDVNTREILRKLSDTLEIPVLGLFDADPYGIEILGIYKYGSKAMAFDVKNLAVPEMRWLGLLPTDIQRLNLPGESTIPMTENDVKKTQHLLKLPYVHHHQQWLNEIKVMLEAQKKAEIEGLSKFSPIFLPTIYLPNKIKHGGWI